MERYIDGLIKGIKKEIKNSSTLTSAEIKQLRLAIKLLELKKSKVPVKIDLKTAVDILTGISLTMEIIKEISPHLK